LRTFFLSRLIFSAQSFSKDQALPLALFPVSSLPPYVFGMEPSLGSLSTYPRPQYPFSRLSLLPRSSPLPSFLGIPQACPVLLLQADGPENPFSCSPSSSLTLLHLLGENEPSPYLPRLPSSLLSLFSCLFTKLRVSFQESRAPCVTGRLLRLFLSTLSTLFLLFLCFLSRPPCTGATFSRIAPARGAALYCSWSGEPLIPPFPRLPSRSLLRAETRCREPSIRPKDAVAIQPYVIVLSYAEREKSSALPPLLFLLTQPLIDRKQRSASQFRSF